MKRNTISDEEILTMLFERKEEALKAVQKQYGARLYVIAERLLNNRADCEECINNMLFRLWRTVPPTHPPYLYGYLVQLTRHAAFDLNKSEKRQKRIPSEFTVALEELENTLACCSRPFENENELAWLLNEFLKGLDEKRRYIFIARFHMATPQKQIAKALSVSESTVCREIERMKEKLRAFLKEME